MPLYWSQVREAGPVPVTEWGMNTHLCPGSSTQAAVATQSVGTLRGSSWKEEKVKPCGMESGRGGKAQAVEWMDVRYPTLGLPESGPEVLLAHGGTPYTICSICVNVTAIVFKGCSSWNSGEFAPQSFPPVYWLLSH